MSFEPLHAIAIQMKSGNVLWTRATSIQEIERAIQSGEEINANSSTEGIGSLSWPTIPMVIVPEAVELYARHGQLPAFD